MRHRVKMPKLGDTTEVVVVLEWLVDVGAEVNDGDALMSVETDKVDTEVPSPGGGTVVELLVAEGDEVGVGAAICVIEA